MSDVEVRVPLPQTGYTDFVFRFVREADDSLRPLSTNDCHVEYFREVFGPWLTRYTPNHDDICRSVACEGFSGDQRFWVAKFGEADCDCAMLFKLTFGGR
ncbi:hypothetical protein [Sphingomonas sp. Leaf242]|uniref:hypothetical protein n=1 Tax=Sphingomonas sp. Leaf242 TaxID=1736304 RepID=UPI00071399B5|nr:hypothetical protein [Sphingomonas sp. Leaf242]KQO13422.1 hypothetical protein ASF09_04065 [Sphingomonas sp. Leaf242]